MMVFSGGKGSPIEKPERSLDASSGYLCVRLDSASRSSNASAE